MIKLIKASMVLLATLSTEAHSQNTDGIVEMGDWINWGNLNSIITPSQSLVYSKLDGESGSRSFTYECDKSWGAGFLFIYKPFHDIYYSRRGDHWVNLAKISIDGTEISALLSKILNPTMHEYLVFPDFDGSDNFTHSDFEQFKLLLANGYQMIITPDREDPVIFDIRGSREMMNIANKNCK